MAKYIFTKATNGIRINILFGEREWNGNPGDFQLYREGKHITIVPKVDAIDGNGRRIIPISNRFDKDRVDWAASNLSVPATDKAAFAELVDNIFTYAGGTTG